MARPASRLVSVGCNAYSSRLLTSEQRLRCATKMSSLCRAEAASKVYMQALDGSADVSGSTTMSWKCSS